MRVLFCHDGPLRKDENNNYYGTAHNDSTFERYYSIAEKLSVAIRVSNINEFEATSSLSRITVKPFTVIACPNMSSMKGQVLNRKLTKKILSKEIEAADFIVVRLPSVLGFITFDIAKKYNKPCLIEVVACPWDAYWNHSLKGKLIAPFMYTAMKKRVYMADYAVYVTNEFLQHRYPTEGKKTNCSNVALTEFDERIIEKRVEKIESMKNDSKLVIGTTAAVNVRYKGQQYIIEALGNLKKEGLTNFEYQVVGGGDQTYLKSIATKYDVIDQVKFLGAMPHNKVFKWLETIDIYTQPSRQEGLPRALIEAMSRGIPSFGARTAGIPELLESEFIFSNSRKNIDEVCGILKSINKEVMLKQATRNYEESKKYDKEVIEKRREAFFMEFKQ